MTRERKKEIRVDNNEGRTATVHGLLKEPVTGQIRLEPHDDRFKCHKCHCNIDQYYGIRHSIYVDDTEMVWCRQCWRRALQTTTRSMAKNPDDPYPKYIHPGGQYYQRLVLKVKHLETWGKS